MDYEKWIFFWDGEKYKRKFKIYICNFKTILFLKKGNFKILNKNGLSNFDIYIFVNVLKFIFKMFYIIINILNFNILIYFKKSMSIMEAIFYLLTQYKFFIDLKISLNILNASKEFQFFNVIYNYIFHFL